MSELEDIKLRALLQDMDLEAPSAKFSVNVMNRIFEEDNVLERIKAQKILGRGFWIIIVLFAVLLVSVFFVQAGDAETSGRLSELLPSPDSGVAQGYNAFLGQLGALPLTIGAILCGASVLLFIDRFISSNSRVFGVQ